MTDERESLAGRLTQYLGDDVTGPGAAKIALAWFRERMPTREEIAVRIYDRMTHDTAWSFASPASKNFCLGVADAILALIDKKVIQ